eukprot:Tamp_10997.p1 GENE.Tamp_10997~~Tamp_10997.p1  ORF type:complete len:568 (+),score=72.90 Tamp_10997:53-1705(+)
MAGAPTAAPSAARPADDAGAAAWARLEFGDGKTLAARGVAFSIGRHDSNDLVSDSAHLSGRHCTLAPLARPEAGDAALVLTDSSTNGIFVDGSKVHKDSVPLRWGQRVELVKGHKSLSFVARECREGADSLARNKTLVADPNDETLSDREDAAAAQGNGAAGGGAGSSSATEKDTVSEHMKCCICLEVLHRVVTLVPCQHNCCAGCYSECMQRSSNCPECRTPVEGVSRNHGLANIITAFLGAHPHLQRAPADLAELDAKDKLPDEALRARKRQRHAVGGGGTGSASPVGSEENSDEDWDSEEEEEEEEEMTCYNCLHASPDGVRCPAVPSSASHRQCLMCAALVPIFSTAPSADNPRPTSSCRGCGMDTCGPFYTWMGRPVLPEDRLAQRCWSHPARLDQLVDFPDLPDSVFRWNAVEREIVLECMRTAGLSSSQLFQHCLFELRAGRLQCPDALGPADGRGLNMTGMTALATAAQADDAHLCRHCVPKLFAGLVYAWRAALPADSLPAVATSFSGGPRDDCWYGSSCRTQVHNSNHARSRNHVCTPTR